MNVCVSLKKMHTENGQFENVQVVLGCLGEKGM